MAVGSLLLVAVAKGSIAGSVLGILAGIAQAIYGRQSKGFQKEIRGNGVWEATKPLAQGAPVPPLWEEELQASGEAEASFRRTFSFPEAEVLPDEETCATGLFAQPALGGPALSRELPDSSFVELLGRLAAEAAALRRGGGASASAPASASWGRGLAVPSLYQESRAATVVMDELACFAGPGGPLVVEEFQFAPGRTNLKVTYPGSSEASTCTVGFIGAHFDVSDAAASLPEGSSSATLCQPCWSSSTPSLVQQGDNLVGPGLGEGLSHVALLTVLLCELARAQPKLQRSVVVIFLAARVTGEGELGADELLRRGALSSLQHGPVFWLDAGAAAAADDWQTEPQICAGSLSSLGWTLRTREAPEPAFPSSFGDPNSIEIASEAVSYIQNAFDTAFSAHPEEAACGFACGSMLQPCSKKAAGAQTDVEMLWEPSADVGRQPTGFPGQMPAASGPSATEPPGEATMATTAGGWDFAAAAKILDLKGVLQPPKFAPDERDFPEWRYQFESTMTLLQMDELMEAAVQAPESPKLCDMTAHQRQGARFLHALLVALTRGVPKAEVLVKGIRDKNGFAAWRTLLREYAPPTADRQTAVLGGLLNPQWDESRPWYPQLLAWENHIADHALETGVDMPDPIKAATLVRHAPENIQAFLQLCPAQITDSYPKLKAAVRGFLQKTIVYDANGVPVMNALMQQDEEPPGRQQRQPAGKAQGKGSSGSRAAASAAGPLTSAASRAASQRQTRATGAKQPFEGVCYRCNKQGHKASDCRVVLQLEEGQQPDTPRGSVGVLREAWKGALDSPYAVLALRDGEDGDESSDDETLPGLVESTDSEAGEEAREREEESSDDEFWAARGPATTTDVVDSMREEAVGPKALLLIDSGSFGHVCPPGFARTWGQPLLGQQVTRRITTATGSVVERTGELRRVYFDLGQGLLAQIDFEILPVTQPILSTGRLAQHGHQVVLGPVGQSYLQCHNKRFPFVCHGSLCYLPAQVLPPPPTVSELAPVSAISTLPVGGPAAEAEEVASAQPTAEARALHRCTHTPYAAWCTTCISAKGTDRPHRRVQREEESNGGGDAPHVLQLDYSFWKAASTESTVPVLLGVVTPGAYAFSAMSRVKGREDMEALRALYDFTLEAGLVGQDLRVRTDSEPAIMALAQALGNRRSPARTFLETAPIKSPGSIGAVDRFAQTALRGQPYQGEVFRFTQPVAARDPEALLNPKLEARWQSGLWLGRSALADDHVVGLAGGILRTRSVKPLAEWTQDLYVQMRWTPWRPQAETVEKTTGQPVPMSTPMPGPVSGGDAFRSAPRATVTGTGGARTAAGRELQAFKAEWGSTPGCPACKRAMGAAHTSWCKKRRVQWSRHKASEPARLPAAELEGAAPPTAEPEGLPATELEGAAPPTAEPEGLPPAEPEGAAMPDAGPEPMEVQLEKRKLEPEGEVPARRLRFKQAPVEKRKHEQTHEAAEEEYEMRVRDAPVGDGGDAAASDMVQQVQRRYARDLQEPDPHPWEHLRRRPSRYGIYTVSEEQEIFVGSEPGWTEDGRELPQDQVEAGRRREMASMRTFEVFRRVRRSEVPTHTRIIGSRFLYTVKRPGEVKARLVAQEVKRSSPYMSFLETFAGCPTSTANRLVIWRALQRGWELLEGDVSTAFLHAPIDGDEEVLIRPPPGMDDDHYWVLQKALYGLRRSPRLWQNWFASQLATVGFCRCRADPQLYYRRSDDALIVTHADDLRLTAAPGELQPLKEALSGLMVLKWGDIMGERWGKFLGSFWRRLVSDAGADVVQVKPHPRHVEAMIEGMGLRTGKGTRSPAWSAQEERKSPGELSEDQQRTYRSLTGVVQWLALVRPDLQYVSKELARSLCSPTTKDWARLKKTARYLQTTKELVLELKVDSTMPLSILVWCDASFASDEQCKSTSGSLVYLQGLLLQSSSKTQAVTAKSSAEAELLGVNSGVSEGLFVQSLLLDVLDEIVPLEALTDSTACLGITGRLGLGRLKHVEVKHLWIQEAVRTRSVSINKVDTQENLADLLTKPLPPAKVEYLRAGVGMKKVSDEREETIAVLDEQPGDAPCCSRCGRACPFCQGQTAAGAGSSSGSSDTRPHVVHVGDVHNYGQERGGQSDGQSLPGAGVRHGVPRPMARAGAIEQSAATAPPARSQPEAEVRQLRGAPTVAQLDYIALLARRRGLQAADFLAGVNTKQQASEVISQLLDSRLG
ncbi:unnamed protein product [Polarella glacialis]|uniref:CCHC-type domain-containing protein n=1 Tax=Polarella glacialis TaxID=89957 RepID=A0A813F218_POLGL|nr:unnamed protein product [Polarella glacialis]